IEALYTEVDIVQVLKVLVNSISFRHAVLDYSIPRSTLHNRLKGYQSRQDGTVQLQRLSPVQEKRLTNWVLVQEGLGLSPTHAQIKSFAQSILALRGDTTALGKRWMQNFLKRN